MKDGKKKTCRKLHVLIGKGRAQYWFGSSADFTSESVATFEDIPSFYADSGTYMSVNLFPNGNIESGTYYLRFKYTTVNPVFLIKSIEVIS